LNLTSSFFSLSICALNVNDLHYREVNGDASEAAILRFMEAQIGNVKKYRSRFKKLCELPFNSRTKYESFVHEIKENNLPVHLVTLKVF